MRMQAYISSPNPDSVITHIAEQGFCIVENFLDSVTVSSLAAEAIDLQTKSELKLAGIGRENHALNAEIRGDSIYWLDAAQATAAQQIYFTQMEQLRLSLNQSLYLGLFGLESHLAVYPAGAFYKRHLDCFANADQTKPQRKISCIVYLNQYWQANDGGELRLYLNTENAEQESYLDIAPLSGRAVIFLSDSFYHEVLPARRERMSLTGWFFTRPQGF
jgi:SM-20-related protein